MRGADLTPTDEVIALLLLAAHQRNMRRRHIKRKLVGQSCCGDQHHLVDCKQSPDAQEQQQQQQAQQQAQPKLMKHCHTGNTVLEGAQPTEQVGQDLCRSGGDGFQQILDGAPSPSGVPLSAAPGLGLSMSLWSAEQTAALSEAQDEASECCAECQCAACQQLRGSDGGLQQGGEQHTVCSRHEEGNLHLQSDQHKQKQQQQQQQQQQHQQQAQQQQPQQQQGQAHRKQQHDSEQQGSRTGKQKIKRPKLSEIHVPTGVDVEQGWGAGNDAEGSDVDYDADDGVVSVFSEGGRGRGCGFPCVITPSSMAAELAPHLTQQEAADIYLGHREAVDKDVLDTAAKFAKYAIAAYGQFGLKFKDEHGHKLGSTRVAMGKRFHAYKRNKLVRSKVKTHEQRMQYEAIIQVAQIQDEDLLYLNFNNSAIGDVPYIICLDRPSRSLVLSIRGTRSLADAATDLLAHPQPLHHWLPNGSWQGEEEEVYGHAGMLGAAAAVWEDLRTHHILAALLDLPAPEECSSHLDGRGDDTSMSRSERERHMEWDSSASLPDDGRLDQEGVAGKGPTAKEHEGDHKAHCSSKPHNEQSEPGADHSCFVDGQQCGLSLDQLGHEDIGRQQEARSEGQQNKFVAGIIRRGLYKDGWQLVITGHSLGAGVAALLSLKMHVRAPGLKCWAFCPPGGLLSQNLSHAAQQYCTSVIVNKDMVPRLSLRTVYRLFEGKMIALARCNNTTSRVLVHALLASSRRILLSNPRLFRPWSQVSNEAKDMLHRFQQQPAKDSISALGLKVGLYPPGKQIFLRRFKKQSQPQHAEDVSWDAVWIQPEEIIGEGIIVSKHATRDHYPYSLLAALEQVTDGAVGHVKRETY
ncbi:hypothetical protein ABBQ32_000037 [Trebouxia sp. C0010 RCD-2024]